MDINIINNPFLDEDGDLTLEALCFGDLPPLDAEQSAQLDAAYAYAHSPSQRSGSIRG